MNKYHNQATVLDGLKFDSKKEAKRWAELKLMERAGEITDLFRQFPITLLRSQRDAKGKVIERPIKYVADFVYTDKATGKMVVEDVKSPATRTDVYKIKKKLMLYFYGIRIKEV